MSGFKPGSQTTVKNLTNKTGLTKPELFPGLKQTWILNYLGSDSTGDCLQYPIICLLDRTDVSCDRDVDICSLNSTWCVFLENFQQYKQYKTV